MNKAGVYIALNSVTLLKFAVLMLAITFTYGLTVLRYDRDS